MTDAPPSESEQAREAARNCEKAGLLGEADILYRFAASLSSPGPESAASLARVLMACGAVETARALAAEGDDPVLPALLALESHDLETARRLLDAARRDDPFDPRSASARGRLAFFEKRFAASVEDLLEAALLRPDGLPDATEARFLRAARGLASEAFPGWAESVRAAQDRLQAAARERHPNLAWPDRGPALVRALVARGGPPEGLLDRARRLGDLPVSGIDDPALLAAAGAGPVRRIGAGGVLYRAGDPSAEILLVLAGAIELVRDTPVGPQPMGSAEPADFAGEEALAPAPRSCDARAPSGATVLEFPPDFFLSGSHRASWLRHLRGRLAARLAALNSRFEEFFPGTSTAKAPGRTGQAEAATLSPEEKSRFLGSGGLTEADRYLIGAFAHEKRYPRESLIFREGDPGEALYVVARGRVRISRHIAGGEEALAILGPGEIFGEMAILNPAAGGRSADARAHEDAVVLELARSRFERLEKSDPDGCADISALLCRLAARRCVETAERLARWRIMAGPSQGFGRP